MSEFVGFDTQEDHERAAVVAEALSWIGTPYHSNGDLKGVGVDCGMILLRVFGNCGLITPLDPRPYPAQWALHQSTERYLELVRTYARELPDGEMGKPGDVVVFKLRNMKIFHHGGIVAPEWPWIVHATPPGTVQKTSVTQNSTLMRLVPKFFTIWPRREGATS